MPVAWELNYDRRVSPEFLRRFAASPLSLLVDVARDAPFPVDLQFRHDPKSGREHASLYVGLTDVLKVDIAPNGVVRLRAHPTWSDTSGQAKAQDWGFRAEWATGLDEPDWSAVEDYLERVLPAATEKHAKQEGSVQSAVSKFKDNGIVMLDREATLHFRDNHTKKRILAEITEPIVAALAGISGVKGAPKTTFGGECDLLGLDRDGNLLAIEIKPRNVGSIRWAAAQATVYAELFTRWLRPDDSRPPALDVLRGEWDQRATLGLAPAVDHRLDTPTSVVPVVVVQRGTRPALLDEFWNVQRRLCDAGVGNPSLLLRQSGLTGRLTDPRAAT